MSDLEIIAQLQAGNEQAFRSLVDQYQKMVLNTCYGIVQNHEDAEDIAQDVFVEVYKSVQYFRVDAKLSTWLNVERNGTHQSFINQPFKRLRKSPPCLC